MSSRDAPVVSPATRPSGPPRWLLPLVVLLGVALHAASLSAGFHADDHMHQLALDGKLPMRWWALFDFGTTSDWTHLQDSVGGFPWWTSPDWKIRFFRPVASASLAVDRALFGDFAPAHHAVSLAWLAAFLVTTYAAARALGLTRGVATLAVALLAASQATTYPAEWLANRNSLLAATFTAGSVAVIASHARIGRGRALACALGLSLLAALSKESGLAAFAAVGAYLWIADHGLPRAWASRAAGTALACAAIYAGALIAAGYGTRSDFYATPWSDPARYASHLGQLGTVGLLAAFTPVLSDLVFVLPDLASALTVAGIVVGIPMIAWLAVRLRGDRTAAFLGAWALVSLLPEAGAPTQDRLLLGAGIGLSCLLAMLLSRVVPAAAGRGRIERIAAWVVIGLAGLESLATLGQSFTMRESARGTREKILATDVGPPSLGRREVIVLQGDDPFVVFTMPATWAWHAGDMNVRFVPLQMGRRALRWTRVDARTMDFTSLGAPFVSYPFETVYRASSVPAPGGTVVQLAGLRVEVIANDADGAVRSIRMTFDTAPDGDRIRFVAPRDGRLTRVAPPAPGETIDLPEAPKAHPFMP